ncbi:MAG: hypothetical protein IKM29_00870 [Clostridia bacterium]|nr:hypothetical protein [Clostridia bacterium]
MEIEKIAAEASAGKYSFLAPGLVLRIAAEEAPKYKKDKDRIKAVKKQLHIFCGAFENDNCHREAEQILGSLNKGEFLGRERLEKLCLLHASTRERLPDMEEFYAFLSSSLGNPESIIDVGCGFAPFCAELLPSVKEYRASDIDARSVSLIGKYLELSGLKGSAYPLDAVSQTPEECADAAFMFKLFPVLEAQKKGRGFEIMKELKVKRIALSFPIRSLGGRDKGMESFYSEKFEGGLPEGFEIKDKKVIGTELLYILEKK